MNASLTVWIRDSERSRLGAEAPFARRLALRCLRKHSLPDTTVEYLQHGEGRRTPPIGAPFIALVNDPELFVGPEWTRTPLDVLAAEPSVGIVGVMSNETSMEHQRTAPPFDYPTPGLFDAAVEEFRRRAPLSWSPAPDLDPFLVFLRSQDFQTYLKAGVSWEDLPTVVAGDGKRLAAARDTYVHRYGSVLDQPREDLLMRIPEEARAVLDVGCARGRLAGELKRRGTAKVVGIERDEHLARAARDVMDEVICGDVETLDSNLFHRVFDAVICGDLLEHLADPWSVLEKLRGWLKPGGMLVGSVPNVGHWSVVRDLLAGRWDYAPFTILSGTHLRFFTEEGIRCALEETGFQVLEVTPVVPALSPPGREFLAKLADSGIWVEERSLRVSEYLVRAQNQ